MVWFSYKNPQAAAGSAPSGPIPVDKTCHVSPLASLPWAEILAKTSSIEHKSATCIPGEASVLAYFLGRHHALSFQHPYCHEISCLLLDEAKTPLNGQVYQSAAKCLTHYYTSGYLGGLQLLATRIDPVPPLFWKLRPDGYEDPVMSAHARLHRQHNNP